MMRVCVHFNYLRFYVLSVADIFYDLRLSSLNLFSCAPQLWNLLSVVAENGPKMVTCVAGLCCLCVCCYKVYTPI
jgi:hypothetical protein